MKPSKIYGIYDVHSGVIGEFVYILAQLIGRKHCALCNITHGTLFKKNDWHALTKRLNVRIELLHLNDQHERMRNFTEGKTPCIVQENQGNYQILLDKVQLQACKGSVSAFETMIGELLT